MLPFLGRAVDVVKATFNLQIGNFFKLTCEYDNALTHLQQCIVFSNGSNPNTAALAHCNLASTWSKLCESEKAYKSVLDAKDCLPNIIDVEAKALITRAVAQTLVEMKRSEEAISFLREELLALDPSGCDPGLRAFYLETVGKMCVDQELSCEGLRYYTECLEMLNVKKTNISGMVKAHLAIANLLHLTGAISEANVQLNKGWKLVLSMSDSDERNEYMRKIAECWEKMGNIREAQKCYKEALTALRFIETRNFRIFEFDLMVKLGDIAKTLPDDGASTLSTEQRQSAQRIHYDNAAEILRRHSASGNFNTETILLFTLLADKYRSIDVFEQEKLLLQALQMSNEASEMTVGILCDLSNIYWDRSNTSISSGYYIRAFKMQLELHSSDPYHKHITVEATMLASLLLGNPENEELRNFAKEVANFFERAQNQTLPVTYEQKANCANSFVSTSYLFICLGDFSKSTLFYRKANEIFDVLEKEKPPNYNTLHTAMKELVCQMLDIISKSPDICSHLISSGLLLCSTPKEEREMPDFSKISSAFNSLKVTAPNESYRDDNNSGGITARDNMLSTSYPESNEIENSGMNDSDNQSASTQKEQNDRKPESSNLANFSQVTEQFPETLNPISLCGSGTTKQKSTSNADYEELPDPSTIISTMDVLGDSVKYDLQSGNINQANEAMESFRRFMPPVYAKYCPIPAEMFISEALRCKDQKRMDLMPPYLNLFVQFTSDKKKKAEIAKLMAESHFYSGKYKMATIQLIEAGAYYSCHSDTASIMEYLEILSGLTRSHMRCNNLEEVRRVCEEAIEFTSSLECGLLKLQYEAEFLFLGATCLMRLAKTEKQDENTTLETVASYCQRGICVIETMEQQLGSSDVVEELTGDVRRKLFAWKCEIQLLLATSFLQLVRKERADAIVIEMNMFLQNISAFVETFSEETWPGDTGFPKLCRRVFSWIGRAHILSGRTEHAIGPLEESLLLFLSDSNVINDEQEEFLDLLDAFTATKKVINHNEITPFLQTIRFCKEKFLEKQSDVKELLKFLDTLASYYVVYERTQEAIVVYEIMLPITECMAVSIAKPYSPSQVLLFLGNCHKKQALKSTGKKAIDERRLAEKYFQVEQETDETATILRKGKYLEMLSEENRVEDAARIISQITKVGDKIWEMMVRCSYFDRQPCARSYLLDHGELLTSAGCIVYSTILRVYLQMGMGKEAGETCEKLAKRGHDIDGSSKRPSFMPYLHAYCHKTLVSFLEKKDCLHFENSDFPLSDKNLAQVYYEMGEHEVALDYCNKTLSSVSSAQNGLPLNMDLLQTYLDFLRISGNAFVLLGKEEHSHSYYLYFLELLESQNGILKKLFEDQRIILEKYDFVALYFVYRSLGILLCKDGNVDGAIKVYEHCIEKLDVDLQYGHGLLGTLAGLYQTKAFTALEGDEIAYSMWMTKAKNCFETYFQTENNPDPFVETTFGALLYRLEEHHKAIVHLENVVQKQNDTIIKFSREDIPLVGAHLAREIETRKEIFLPLNIYANFVTANAYKKLNKTEKAEEVVCKMDDLCSVLNSDPNYLLILAVLGYAYKNIGNDEKAAKIFQNVLDKQPGHAPVMIAFARLFDN